MSETTGSTVYTGPWINWSHGPILGSTLTLSTRDGSLLTAFLAMFVTVTGAAWWRISSYLLHQSRASQDYQDGVHHQHQAILRNTSGPAGAAWQLVQTMWYWRKNAVRPTLRTLPVLLLALLNLTIFAVAGIFSSEVTKAAGNETLVRSPNCGYLDIPTDDPKQTAWNTVELNDTLTATAYQRACYGGKQNTLQCNQYAQQSIPWKSNQNATCPFGDDICIYGATAAYEMDTGKLDSHEDLGINARKSHRVQLRKVTTCSNLHTKNYVNIVNDTNPDELAYGDSLWQFLYGVQPPDTNYTYQYDTHAPVDNLGFGLQAYIAMANYSDPTWIPIPALNRTDADVSLFFITPNSLIYGEPVYDPLFTATTPTYIPFNGTNATWYSADRYVYVLGCTDQIQFCNPNNGVCTDMTGPSNLQVGALEAAKLGFNGAQLSTSLQMGLAIPGQTTYDVVNPRGPNSLLASEKVYDLRSPGLPNNQWMNEVSSWFGISMAKLQQKIVQLATGPENIPEGATLKHLASESKFTKHLCDNQKIRSSSGTISFSVLGVAIILVVGSLIIFTNLILDMLVGFIRRKTGWNDYKRLQWILDEKLQLQRLAYEGANQGEWSGGLDAVPVTEYGNRFGLPREVNMLHPRLSQQGLAQETRYTGGGGMPEQQGLMGNKSAHYTVQPVSP